jgi:hypothetical protein
MLWMWCKFGVSLVADLLRWTRLYDPASVSGIIWCVVNYGGGSGVVKLAEINRNHARTIHNIDNISTTAEEHRMVSPILPMYCSLARFVSKRSMGWLAGYCNV